MKSQLKPQTYNLTAGVIISLRRNNYPQGLQEKKQFFSQKKSHSAENEPTLYLNTLSRTIPYLITLNRTILIHCRNHALSYYIAEL